MTLHIPAKVLIHVTCGHNTSVLLCPNFEKVGRAYIAFGLSVFAYVHLFVTFFKLLNGAG